MTVFSDPDAQTAQDGPSSPVTPSDTHDLTAGITRAINSVLDQQDDAAQVWSAGRLAFRCTPGYAIWVGALSTWTAVPASTVIDQALRRYAESVGFPAGPPPRLPTRAVGQPTAQTIADFRGYHGTETDIQR